MIPDRRKILMLHGYSQGGPVFGVQSAKLRKALTARGYTLVYATVPLISETEMSSFEVPHTKKEHTIPKCWIPGTEEYDFDYLFGTISDLQQEHGNFDGVIGLSLNDALGPTLRSQQLSEKFPNLKWSISLSEKSVILNRTTFHTFSTPMYHAFHDKEGDSEIGDGIPFYREKTRSYSSLQKHGPLIPRSSGLIHNISEWILSVHKDFE